MYAQVMRHQFEIQDGSIIHTPTGAEFTPTSGSAESLTVWTGDLGRRLPSGEIYGYAEVLVAIKALWRELTMESSTSN